MEPIGVLIFIFALLLIIALFSIKVVRQSEVYIIERLGKFHKEANAGLNIIVPFVDRVRAVVSLKQQTMDVPPQGVITKDNVNINIDTVVFYQITEPAKAVYEIENLQKGIAYLAITTIRDIVGKMDLDSTFSSRDSINTHLRDVLDQATDKWGCKVERVEIKDIKPPADIRDAMEKQMNAERTKRAAILEAEGKSQADITHAEGTKQAIILEAEAERESSIRRAQGFREARILESEGTSEAIRKIADAKAQEIKLVYGAIMEAKPNDHLVAIKTLESLEKVAEGPANKVFIPFDATKALGSLGAAKEIFNEK
ncbi:MAG: SPFH/Band 7/PHB domain protein [Clostridia bacterium]|nr:SPFH/Band 7/PHB domain protein [Clostridia bacterium]MDD4375617.1 SPFH/Band 7/PHB domain protein [Clostridia bacterium]